MRLTPKDFQDFDPTVNRGDGCFIMLNLSMGVVIALITRNWLLWLGLVLVWAILRTCSRGCATRIGHLSPALWRAASTAQSVQSSLTI